MGSRKMKWLSSIGAVLIVGGIVMASAGSWVTSAGAASGPGKEGHPFAQILNKLDEILAAIGNIGGGEGGGQGGQEGNHTLRWDQALSGEERFVLVMGGAAVLDKNTGLVWEQAPDADFYSWSTAVFLCVNKNVGGTRGWRLPSVAELASLIDPSLPSPFVPMSVFTGVQPADYWSATTLAGNPSVAWFVNGFPGLVSTISKTTTIHVWCVRGGMNADQY